MEINCEKCGTIATGLTRLLAKHQQREHVLNHRRVRVGVIVTVEDDDSFGTSPRSQSSGRAHSARGRALSSNDGVCDS